MKYTNHLMASIFCCGVGTGTGTMSTQSESRSAPWLMVSPTADAYRFYSLAEAKFKIFEKGAEAPEMDARVVGSSHGWLALQEKRQLFLSNPLSRRHIKLPALKSKNVSKLVISCSPEREECRAVVCGRGGAAFCLPGRSREWTPLGRVNKADGNYKYNYDVAYSSRRKVFTCSSGIYPALDVEDWDLRDPLSPKIDYEMDWHRMKTTIKEIERPWISMGPCRLLRHPLHVGEDMYFIYRFVVRKTGRTGDFIIFKVGQSQFENVDTFNDLAAFLGINHAFALPAAQFPPLKADSLYIKDHMCCLQPQPPIRKDPLSDLYFNYSKIATCWFTPT